MTRMLFRIAAAVVGLFGLGASAAAAFIDTAQFYSGWLFGFLVWIGFSVGALLILMAHDLTGGGWGDRLRPPLEAATASLPIASLAFLPLLPGLARLYPWLRPQEAGELANRFYLNRELFLLRALSYFVIWFVFAALSLQPGPRRTSAPGLIVSAVAATFAAFDWSMSLQPRWASSIYGLFVTVANVEAALALAVLFALASGLLRDRLGDVGNLLFAGILLWAYIAFVQFLIIWEEDLPNEIFYYLARASGNWGGVTVAMAVCAVAVPFLILVWWPLKRHPAAVASAAVILLLGYLLTQGWLIFPALPGTLGWPAAAAFFGIGGLWIALADLWLEYGGLPHPFGAGHA